MLQGNGAFLKVARVWEAVVEADNAVDEMSGLWNNVNDCVHRCQRSQELLCGD